jgi:hypothetical protein
MFRLEIVDNSLQSDMDLVYLLLHEVVRIHIYILLCKNLSNV